MLYKTRLVEVEGRGLVVLYDKNGEWKENLMDALPTAAEMKPRPVNLEQEVRRDVLAAVKACAGTLAKFATPGKIPPSPKKRHEILTLMRELTALCRSAGLAAPARVGHPAKPKRPEEVPGTPEYRRFNGTPGYHDMLMRSGRDPRTNFNAEGGDDENRS